MPMQEIEHEKFEEFEYGITREYQSDGWEQFNVAVFRPKAYEACATARCTTLKEAQEAIAQLVERCRTEQQS